MKHAVLVLLFSTLLVTACGKARHRSGTDPIAPPVPGEEDPIDWSKVKTQLVLFGAPPCSACKEAFPKINAQLNALSASQRAEIAVQLYVETGVGWNDPATTDIARAYRKQEGFRCPLFLDGYDLRHKRPNYAKMLDLAGEVFDGTIEVGLPVAVILDQNGNFADPGNKKPDIFPPGLTTFIPENIVGRVLTHLAERQ